MTWSHSYIPSREAIANALDAVPLDSLSTAYQVFLAQKQPRLRLDSLKEMLDYWTSLGWVEKLQIGKKFYYRKLRERLARPSVAEYTRRQRVEDSLTADVDWFYQALAPLRSGLPVFLLMDGVRMVKRKGTNAGARRLVVLTPGALLGVNPKSVLVSVVGSGSCVIRADAPAKVANLVLAGVPAMLANLLMNTVHHVLKE